MFGLTGGSDRLKEYFDEGDKDTRLKNSVQQNTHQIDRSIYNVPESGAIDLQNRVVRNANEAGRDANSDSALQRFNVDKGRTYLQPTSQAAMQFRAPQYQAGTPAAAAQAMLNQQRTNSSLGTAQGYLGAQNQTRDLQGGQLGYLQQMQYGGGPSVGALQAQQGAQTAAGLMGDAGAQASRAMSQSQAAASGAYGDATGMQGRQTQQAAWQARNLLADNASANVRAQASLAARARGGSIGASLLNAQNNASAANQSAGIQQGRVMMDANRNAADNAAMAMRAAQQADVQSRLQSAGALERGSIQAGMVGRDMMLEGAKIRSNEQLQATGMMTDALGNVRGQDLGAAQAATGLAGVNLSADAQQGDMTRFNADLGLRAQGMNADDAYRYAGLNSGNTLQTNALNAAQKRDYDFQRQNQSLAYDQLNSADAQARALANQRAEIAARGMYDSNALAYNQMAQGQYNTQQGMRVRGEEAVVDQKEHAIDRATNLRTNQATMSAQRNSINAQNDANSTNAMIGAGAGIAAAMISDIRAKKEIKPADRAVQAMTNAFRDARPNLGVLAGPDIEMLRGVNPAEPADRAVQAKNPEHLGVLSGPDIDRANSFRDARPYEYEYKDKADGAGKYVGPMAQDMPAGTVTKSKDGKLGIDMNRTVLAMSSALGEQQRKIDRLERGR